MILLPVRDQRLPFPTDFPFRRVPVSQIRPFFLSYQPSSLENRALMGEFSRVPAPVLTVHRTEGVSLVSPSGEFGRLTREEICKSGFSGSEPRDRSSWCLWSGRNMLRRYTRTPVLICAYP